MVTAGLILKLFLFGFVIDILWVLWFLSVRDDKMWLAAVSSMAMAAPAINGYAAIYDDRIMQIPYLIGLGAGTIVGMYLHKKIGKKQKVE